MQHSIMFQNFLSECSSYYDEECKKAWVMLWLGGELKNGGGERFALRAHPCSTRLN